MSHWRKEYSEGGKKALAQAGLAGRKPRLNAKQTKVSTSRLLAGPEKLGYEKSLWTCERVAGLIAQEFGIHYHPGHVWRILRGLGWSPQSPLGRAQERMRKRSGNGNVSHGPLQRKALTESRTIILVAAELQLQSNASPVLMTGVRASRSWAFYAGAPLVLPRSP